MIVPDHSNPVEVDYLVVSFHLVLNFYGPQFFVKVSRAFYNLKSSMCGCGCYMPPNPMELNGAWKAQLLIYISLEPMEVGPFPIEVEKCSDKGEIIFNCFFSVGFNLWVLGSSSKLSLLLVLGAI